MPRVAVIGAGLGGISAAIRLRAAGYEVDVLEKNSLPGGKAGSISVNGFRFDTGPSLLTMPFVLDELFKAAGEDINHHLVIRKPEIICKYFYPGNTTINAWSDPDKFAEEIGEKTNETPKRLKQYLKHCRDIYDLTAELFLFNSPSSLKTYLNVNALRTLLKINKIDPFRTMHDANSDFFTDERVVQLFDRYATYNGSDPYRAPATLNIIQHVEYNMGGFIVEGGVYAITESLHKLAAKLDVRFLFNTNVKKIIHNNRTVSGLMFNDSETEYDAIISGADLHHTYRSLLNDRSSLDNFRYNRTEPSLSGIVFYWGVRGVHDNLSIHNIVFSSDYKREFQDIFERKVCPDEPTVYIYISSKFNAEDAPEGNENWFVMINAPYLENQNWENEINKTREKAIKAITDVTGIDIRNRILFEKMLTPQILKDSMNSFKGSIYGISSNNRFAAFLRHPNRSPYYKGLYFCGGSVHPGGGIPLVILSGKIATDLVLQDYVD